MTINSAGYDGDFSDSDLARLAPFMGVYGRFCVLSSLHCAVVPNTNTDRGVTVKAGMAFGDSVVDTLTTYENVAFSAPPIGTTRWGAVVLTRDWSSGVKATTVRAVLGTTDTPIPPTSLSNGAGVKSDQVLALCKVVAGSSSIAEIRDRRTWVEGPRLQTASRLTQAQFNTGAAGGSFAAMTTAHRAGEYLLHGLASSYGNASLAGTVQLVANGTALTGIYSNVGTDPEVIAVTSPYTHLGGDLAVSLFGQFNGTGIVFCLPGSRVISQWVGPVP